MVIKYRVSPLAAKALPPPIVQWVLFLAQARVSFDHPWRIFVAGCRGTLGEAAFS
jgi:hypothetical protein